MRYYLDYGRQNWRLLSLLFPLIVIGIGCSITAIVIAALRLA